MYIYLSVHESGAVGRGRERAVKERKKDHWSKIGLSSKTE
jgi:hypothetical protein